MTTIVLDAGHGGYDFGATFEGRREKDDVLALTLAVGQILSQNPDLNILYTREGEIKVNTSVDGGNGAFGALVGMIATAINTAIAAEIILLIFICLSCS